MTFENYIKVNGEYRKQETLSPKEMKEIARKLQIRFMDTLGFVPKEKTA